MIAVCSGRDNHSNKDADIFSVLGFVGWSDPALCKYMCTVK